MRQPPTRFVILRSEESHQPVILNDPPFFLLLVQKKEPKKTTTRKSAHPHLPIATRVCARACLCTHDNNETLIIKRLGGRTLKDNYFSPFTFHFSLFTLHFSLFSLHSSLFPTFSCFLLSLVVFAGVV